MERPLKVFMLAAAVFVLVSGFKAAAQEVPSQAVAAAEEWLNLVDGARYSESWDSAAQLFKGSVSKEQWEQAVRSVRGPLGVRISKTLKEAKFATSLPGVPDGEYVVMQFESSFENKEAALETVTPMKDPDGQWRVSGYYIK